MGLQFRQQHWDEQLEDDCRQLVRLAVREDLDRLFDLTTMALAPPNALGQAVFVVRQAGRIAGLRAIPLCLAELNIDCDWQPQVEDGAAVEAGAVVATIAGSARDLLTSERILLNLLGRLSGVATLAARYVSEVRGEQARIYDTRKTTLGHRRLEKYAVRCGGGFNHRTGLFDAVLIKDNHLALAQPDARGEPLSPAQAVRQAREFLAAALPEAAPGIIVEIEVDTLQQLRAVAPAAPDAILLDNMSVDELRQAARFRDQHAPRIQLEASGGVNLETVAAIAQTGVDRISVGALTHSAVSLDIGLDWNMKDGSP